MALNCFQGGVKNCAHFFLNWVYLSISTSLGKKQNKQKKATTTTIVLSTCGIYQKMLCSVRKCFFFFFFNHPNVPNLDAFFTIFLKKTPNKIGCFHDQYFFISLNFWEWSVAEGNTILFFLALLLVPLKMQIYRTIQRLCSPIRGAFSCGVWHISQWLSEA